MADDHVPNTVTGRELGLQLCELFGLDPDATATITIVINPSEVARITVERLFLDTEPARLVTMLGEYRLHRVSESEVTVRDDGPEP